MTTRLWDSDRPGGSFEGQYRAGRIVLSVLLATAVKIYIDKIADLERDVAFDLESRHLVKHAPSG